MESPFRQPQGLFHALQTRQTCSNNQLERGLCWNESTIRRIFPDDPLTGHSGCVNRLAWNETGDILASTGDDTDVRLWPYPTLDSTHCTSLVIPTAHHANIFGLQFLPQSGSSKIATGAMDHSVQLHTIDATPFAGNFSASSPRPTLLGARARWSPGRTISRNHRTITNPNLEDSGRENINGGAGAGGGESDGEEEEQQQRDTSRVADVHTTQFNCHRGRIKEIQVHPEEPSLFWSVSEDGTIRQYDMRVPSYQQNSFESGNVLLAVQKRKNATSFSSSSSQRGRRRGASRSQHQHPSSTSEQQHQNLNNVGAGAAAATAMPTPTAAAGGSGEPVVYRSFARTQQEQFTATTNLAELKSFAINPLRPMQLAVAASDKYVRIYDRRRLSLGNFENAAAAAIGNSNSNSYSNSGNLPTGLVMELMPPHIALGPSNLGGSLDQNEGHPTHITFSNSGNRLLATYHGNHAFMWSAPSLFAGAQRNSTAVSANVSFKTGGGGAGSSGSGSLSAVDWNFNIDRRWPHDGQSQQQQLRLRGAPILSSQNSAGIGPYSLPAVAEMHRLAANLALYDKEYIKALSEYNAALKIVPRSAVLLTGRALVLLSRNWIGDKVEALRDAEDAVYYDGENMVAQVRRAQALFNCELLESTAVAIRLCRLLCNSTGIRTKDMLRSEYEDELRVLEEKLREKLVRKQQEKIKFQLENTAAREARRRRGLNLHRRSPGRDTSGEYSRRRDSSDNNNNNTAAAAAAAAEEGREAPAAINASASAAAPMEIEINNEEQQQGRYCSEDDDDSDGGKHEEEDKVEFGHKFVERLDKAFAESLEKEYQKIISATGFLQSGGGGIGAGGSSLTPSPWLWGALPSSSSYLQRFVGHCNLQTDIKEAVFLGQDDSYVAAGSDDGRIYLYDASSGMCLRTLVGDEDIVNCIRTHPHLPVIATSGIDSTVKLWSPSSTALAVAASDIEACCAANQHTLTEGVRRMHGLNERLFEILTQHPGLFGELNRRVRVDLAVGRHGGGGGVEEEDEDDEGEGGEQPPVQCRVI